MGNKQAIVSVQMTLTSSIMAYFLLHIAILNKRAEYYCAMNISNLSEYFEIHDSESTFSAVLLTLYSMTTLKRSSTSSSVHTKLPFLAFALDLVAFSFELDF